MTVRPATYLCEYLLPYQAAQLFGVEITEGWKSRLWTVMQAEKVAMVYPDGNAPYNARVRTRDVYDVLESASWQAAHSGP